MFDLKAKFMLQFGGDQRSMAGFGIFFDAKKGDVLGVCV
jgi:hypothetical protein